MITLRPGSVGPFVKKWQLFLRGLNDDSSVVANGTYDETTLKETIEFQVSNNLTGDGVVGPQTISAALRVGFDVVRDDSADQSGPNWPTRPAVGQLQFQEKLKQFGKFAYVSAPTKYNPEAIKIIDDWVSKNIVNVEVPSLKGISGSGNAVVQVHSKVSRQFLKLFDDWNTAGLNKKILTWGGAWSPRFIRGSRTSLSNHAWGTAFDINVQWNSLGVRPALKDEKGSVRELVQLAYENGFYWGGWFPSRPDGMHFEAYKIID